MPNQSLNTNNLYDLYRTVLKSSSAYGNYLEIECPSVVGLPWPMFGYSQSWPTTSIELDQRLTFIRDLVNNGKCPPIIIVPRSKPMEAIEPLFPQHGFVPVALWPAMNRPFNPNGPLAPNGHSFFAGNTKHIDQWREIVNKVHFPQSPLSNDYVRQLSQTQGISLVLSGTEQWPVAACLTFDNGNSLGIYMVATLPDHRRMGHSSNMLSFLAQSSKKTLILQATLTSAQLYKGLGFETVGEYLIYRLK
jgi:ribosomal protein S18 acetylase RimI-like enzyme